MPWCEECAKYWAPSAMREDGTCPTCGRRIEAPTSRATHTTPVTQAPPTTQATPNPPNPPNTPITAKNLDLHKLAGEESSSAPWHFKLLMVLLVLYLGWRLVDLIL